MTSLKKHLTNFIKRQGSVTLSQVFDSVDEFNRLQHKNIKQSTAERKLREITNEERIEAIRDKKGQITGYETVIQEFTTEKEYICDCDDGTPLYGQCHFPEERGQTQLF